MGGEALYSNTTGTDNTALGHDSLYGNTTGTQNTATGWDALYSNTIGSYNTANGLNALKFNNTGNSNTAEGTNSLYNNTTGNSNVAVGDQTLLGNTSGSSNIAVGSSAGSSLSTGSNNIDIGNKGIAGESNTIRIGKKGTQTATYIAGIRGTTVSGGITVQIDTNGRLGTTASSARFKQNIQPMNEASESIHALKPVTFHYNKELDHSGSLQFGLVAEEVEKVNPALVVYDDDGKPYTVRYEAVDAMLLNEFLKEHRKVEGLEAALAEQKQQIEALTTGLKESSSQLRATKSAARLVTNHRLEYILADNSQ